MNEIYIEQLNFINNLRLSKLFLLSQVINCLDIDVIGAMTLVIASRRWRCDEVTSVFGYRTKYGL